MKHFLRPYRYVAVAAVGLSIAVLASPPGAAAQIKEVKHLFREVNPLSSHTPGYLGVLVGDVDAEQAGKLHLKDARGAVITLIDHDAPAGQVGLRVNDVVLSINGNNVQSAEVFSRMLHEVTAGHKVNLGISRDGVMQDFTVELVDRKVMEHDVWNKMNSADAFPPPPAGMGMLAGGGGDTSSAGFHMPWFGSSLHVGAMVEPLTSQMADYLGVPNGVMVKQVARKSEADIAGLRPYDIVLRVGNEPIKTTADWDRALRSNVGKAVPISILRERKQQVLNMQVRAKRR